MHEDPTLPLYGEHAAPSGAASSRDAAERKDSWGPFKLLARVGHGGFGEVYRAWDPTLEREVALKLLLPGSSGAGQSDREYKAMLREARALAAIQHPNIVHVYGIDRHDGRVGFWTDFVKGRTLSSLLGSQGPFGYREAALIALDLTRALSAVHRAGILHRDIKAENVMREEGGRILLMDFGLSTLPQRETQVSGTPSYIAPELWYGDPATVQSDIYALGVLLFHLVTGEYPVVLGGLSAEQAVAALKNRRTLLDFRSDLPESFLRAVDRATEADPAKRFSSVGQLAAALAESIGAPAPSESTTKQVAAKNRRIPIVAGIGIAVLALAAAGYSPSTLRHWLHLGGDPAPAAVSADLSDEYIQARFLLEHSYKDSNLAAAVAGFQHILDKDSKNALALAGIGTARFEQYRGDPSNSKLFDQAKADINNAIQLDPNVAPAYAARARMEAMAGDTDLALKDAQKAVGLDRRSPEAYAALAEVYDARGKESDAIDAIQQAIDLAPENSMWVVRQAGYYLDKGDSKTAAQKFQEAVDKDDQNVSALFDLGIVQMRSGQLEQARANFKTVLKIEPDADSYKSLATISLLEGKFSDAVEMDKKALSLNAQSYQAWGNLASAYSWSGNRTEALENYKKAIDLANAASAKAPNDPGLLADLANYYASSGDATHSLPLIRKALALSPSDPHVSYVAGESYELLGKREDAIPLVAKATAAGYQPRLFQRSPEMASLRNDPVFQAALAKEKSAKLVDSAK
jgi:serine/threonine-protein kinase